jgi:large subunit ribosomal protein L3
VSESNITKTEKLSTADSQGVQLNGIFAFKEGMSSVFNEKGEAIPVTILRYEPWVVVRNKTNEKDGYDSVQIACRPMKAKNSKKAAKSALKSAGFENGAALVREVKGKVDAPSGAAVLIESLKKGDFVSVTGVTKGHGFCGSQRRWNFAGGPAAHGSKFHRRPGSSGNRTWPGRVMPGKKFPGHYGVEKNTRKNVEVVEVLKDENVIFIKGPAPGSRNSLLQLVKE